MAEEKIMNLEDFKKSIQKTQGKGAVISALDKESYGDVIPCTSFSLRNALGIGGFAKRKLYTVDGQYSTGKSTLCYDVIGHAMKTYGDNCLLIDKEDAYTTDYGELLGIDNEKLTIVTPKTQEGMYDILIDALNSNLFGVIAVDSVTAFAPEARFEGSVVMGIEARVNSDKMRLVADALSKSNTCLIMIQQQRSKIGVIGDPTTVSGGDAIPFYSHVRIRITRSEIKRDEQQNTMKFTVIKNKMAPPFRVGTIVFKWGVGFDFSSEIGQLATEFGIIGKTGNTFHLPEINPEEFKITSKKKLGEFLNDNPEYIKNVLEPRVLERLKDNPIREDEGTEELN